MKKQIYDFVIVGSDIDGNIVNLGVNKYIIPYNKPLKIRK